MRLIQAVLAAASAVLAFAAAPAAASPDVRYGVQDDAWLASGAGTLESRLDLLERLGVSLVRFRLRWDQIAQRRPTDARSPSDPAYDWEPAASVLTRAARSQDHSGGGDLGGRRTGRTVGALRPGRRRASGAWPASPTPPRSASPGCGTG